MKSGPEQFKGAETKETGKFAEQAISQEKGLLDKFRGRAKEIAGTLVLVTILSFLPEMIKNSEKLKNTGPESKQAEQAEKEKSLPYEPVNFLERLYTLPDNPDAVSPSHNEILKERAARQLIQVFAIVQQSEKFQARITRVSPEDISKAVVDLHAAQLEFADKVLGNGDGKTDSQEMAALNEASRTNPGLRAVTGMFVAFAEGQNK